MARLHEYQGKSLLAQKGIPVPSGRVAASPEEAARAAAEIGGPVVVKMQAWVTGRAALGGIRLAQGPEEAALAARAMLGKHVGGFTVDHVLVEQRLPVAREFYAGVIVSDRERAPVILFSSVGGSGVEEIAQHHPEALSSCAVDVERGLRDHQARNLVRRTGIHGLLQREIADVLVKLYDVARTWEARAAEINPLVLTEGGALVAADCRITVDDYAVFRHKDLGITFARELDRPPTPLERIAYAVEEGDYRGTFYFIQLLEGFRRGERVIGFHGAGGGGSMMSMDAAVSAGFRLANFVDTSGNPPASKVYRAARLILSQGPIDGYFGSGSGVASQEQFHSARGLAKAFLETPLTVPAVIRLGGNAEDKAVAILERVNGRVPAPVEGFRKDDTPEFCAQRLRALVDGYCPPERPAAGRRRPLPQRPYSFSTVTGGTITFDHAICATCTSKVCVRECAGQILRLDEDGCPVLAISPEEARKGRCNECLACDVDCLFEGAGGGYVELPIAGLDEYCRPLHPQGRANDGHSD
jgi:succinyl-CoA synthetase beta subunit